MKILYLALLVIFMVTASGVTVQHADAMFATYSRISSTIASGNNVFVTWDDSDGNSTYIIFRASHDGGDTFAKPIVVASNVGVAIPTKVATSSNNVYVTWSDNPQKGIPHIYLRKSTDSGGTFGDTVMLSDPSTICASVTNLAVTGPDVYLFFTCYDPESRQGSIAFRASHDNATTFGMPITLFKGPGIYSNIFLSVAVEGKNIYIVSQGNYAFGQLPEGMLYRKSSDGGETFSPAVDLGTRDVWHESPQVVASGSHVYVMWRDWYDSNYMDLMMRTSNDSGQTFGDAVKLNAGKPSTEIYNIPFLSAKPDGTVYVSWEEIHHAEGDAQGQILRASTDDGKSFGQESNLTDASGFVNLADGGFAAGSGKNLYYAWSKTIQPFDTNSAYFENSPDGGKTIGPKRDLNDLNKGLHDMYPKIVTASGDSVYVTGDSNDRGREIFFVSSHDNGTTFGSVVNINDFSSPAAASPSQIPSPLAQVRSGVAAQDVKCGEGLELVVRSDDGSPACVRHASLARLLLHGWSYGISSVSREAGDRTHEVITIGGPIPGTDGLVPLTTTEITKNAGSLDSIKVWDFIPIEHDADSIHKTWDSLPSNYTKFFSVTDANGTDILDNSRLPSPFFVTLELRTYPAICGQERVVGEGGHPPVMPIKSGHPVVYAQNAEQGLLPDSNGTYSVRFLSFFDTSVELPKGAQIMANQSKSCFLENRVDSFSEAFYTNLSFRLG